MEKNLPDFIGKYNNVFPDGYCDHLIEEFDRLSYIRGIMHNRQSQNAPKHDKEDLAVELSIVEEPLKRFKNEWNTHDVFYEGLQDCLDQYLREYSLVVGPLTCTNIKLQKTSPGGGYHVWHSEKSGRDPTRYLAWIIYLNSLDNDDGGETEFYYYRQRNRPIANTCLLFPSSFTHAHRGNLVLGTEAKYIATGWFLFN